MKASGLCKTSISCLISLPKAVLRGKLVSLVCASEQFFPEPSFHILWSRNPKVFLRKCMLSPNVCILHLLSGFWEFLTPYLVIGRYSWIQCGERKVKQIWFRRIAVSHELWWRGLGLKELVSWHHLNVKAQPETKNKHSLWLRTHSVC